MSEKPKPPAQTPPAKPGATATPAEMAQAEKLLAGDKTGDTHAAAKHDAPKAKAPGGKKKKASKGKSGPSLVARIKSAAQITRAHFVEIFKGLRSPDRPTRRGSLLFFLSLVALVVIASLYFLRAARLHRERDHAIAAAQEEAVARSHEAELLGRSETHESEKHTVNMLNVGLFTIELKKTKREEAPKGSFMNLAEVEVVLECDSAEAHDYLEENLVQARSQMTNIFLEIDREELLSREGKRKLKKRLLERLNGWVPHGKVQNVFFSKLVVD